MHWLLASVLLLAPSQAPFWEARPIQVTGLAPMQVIAIRATTIDAKGQAFTSRAEFVADSMGRVDVEHSFASGDYEGVEPMGLFWSARGAAAMELPLTGSVKATIQVEDREGHALASTQMERVVVPAKVRVTELHPPGAPFVGRLYSQPPVTRKRPMVVTLTGSNGGIDRRMAPYLATYGFDVLALGYFHGEGLPDDLIEIPLESLEAAVEWLARRPDSNGQVAVIGISKGAEAALLLASYYPKRVQAVAALVPSHVVWEGVDARAHFRGDPQFDAPGKSSWSLHGKPLPFVHKVISPARMAKRPVTFLDAYLPALDTAPDPATRIPVERIRAAVFLASVGDDLVWPSLRMAREIKSRLTTRRAELWEYPLAGHLGTAPPGLPASTIMGGTLAANAKSSADVWSHLRTFLTAALLSARDPSLGR